MLTQVWQTARFVVIVGVDFSPECKVALETACGIARSVGRANIHVVHAGAPR